MVKERVPETDEGIQSGDVVKDFNLMQKGMRDKKLLSTDDIIKSGINSGRCLEIGPGPGYLGLEWLSRTSGTELAGLEISAEMILMAEKNASDYGMSGRASYRNGNALDMPFSGESFDAAFSNGSLHEWENPVQVINEIFRVLKPEGRFFISDLKRDLIMPVFLLMKLTVKPKSMRAGLVTSVNAAYTVDEITELMSKTEFRGSFSVSESLFGITVSGRKNNPEWSGKSL